MPSSKTAGAIAMALRELVAERAVIDKAISELEALVGGASGRPRGRPAGATKGAGRKKVTSGRKRTGWSAAKRKAAAERMKKYWAERRKAKA